MKDCIFSGGPYNGVVKLPHTAADSILMDDLENKNQYRYDKFGEWKMGVYFPKFICLYKFTGTLKWVPVQ